MTSHDADSHEDQAPASGRAPFRVVVLGAGYAGVVAANRILATLDRRRILSQVDLTVVNPHAEFVERIRLHQVAAGSTPTATFPLSKVLHPAARLLVGTAQIVDATHKSVQGDDWSLPYDALVYAVGSKPSTATPGVARHAHSLDLEGAKALAERLGDLLPGGIVTVVGGGLTGVETAAEIAEQRPDLSVHLLSAGLIVPGLSPSGRARVGARLDRLGVVRHERVTVTAVREGHLVMDDESLDFDACVWAGEMTVPQLASHSLLATDDIGRLIVDETLRHPAHPDIIGAGDAVALPGHVGSHLRMSCAAALPSGAHAGDIVLAAIQASRGKRVAVNPLSIGFAMQCISLGRSRGVVQFVRADDAPRRLALSGRIAAAVKEVVCRYTVASMSTERALPVAHVGSRGPRRSRVSLALDMASMHNGEGH